MKHTIEYNLPDDAFDLKLSNKSWEMYKALDAVRDFLRSKDKYSEEPPGTWSDVREAIIEIITEHDAWVEE